MPRPGALVLVAMLVGCSSEGAGPAGEARWTALEGLPTPRSEIAAAATGDGRIVVAGGFAPPSSTVATVEIFDPGTGRWTQGPPLPIAVNHPLAASWGGTVYVFGGYTVEGPPSDRAFALRDDRWVPLPPMPEPRAAGGAATSGGEGAERIYLVGGIGADGLATSTMVFDPRTEAWSTMPGLRRPREHLGVAATASSVFAVGGRSAEEGNFGTTEELPVAEGEWRPLDDMPTPRGGMSAAATAGGMIVAVGGEDPSTTFPDVEALTTSGADREWIELARLPTARHGLSAVAIGDTVYALGGGTEPGMSFSPANEAITLDAAPG